MRAARRTTRATETIGRQPMAARWRTRRPSMRGRTPTPSFPARPWRRHCSSSRSRKRCRHPGGVGRGLRTEAAALSCQVAQIKIGYAKVAKQVDIKGLKAGVWELLQDVDGEARKAGAVQVSFQEVLQQLPSKVEASQLPDVSFAYCFISLLHLANERGLEIADDKDRLSDLRVTMPR